MVQGLIKISVMSLVFSYLSQNSDTAGLAACASHHWTDQQVVPQLMCPVRKMMFSQNLQALETNSTQTHSVQITVPLPDHTPLELEERNHQSPNTTTVKDMGDNLLVL